jgi:hypothetical protein
MSLQKLSGEELTKGAAAMLGVSQNLGGKWIDSLTMQSANQVRALHREALRRSNASNTQGHDDKVIQKQHVKDRVA